MADDRKKDEITGVDTTGHTWDGIEELNSPLPRWWLWTFYLTIIWGIGYTIAYPAWPMISGATSGLLGYSTRAEVAKDIQEFVDANAQIEAELASANLVEVTPGMPVYDYARNAGEAVFKANCSQCHGSGADGVRDGNGYPNLLDDDWLWGGDIETIEYTIRHGIRNDTDPDAHYSEMPAFGEFMEPGEIDAIAQYVLSLSGQDHDGGLAGQGAPLFADNCAACHMDDGSGDRAQGAPNLTDGIWLYGRDVGSITQTIANARFGVMPAWGQRLDEADVKAVALYVHQLGGGEPSE